MHANLADLYLFSAVVTGSLFAASLTFKIRNFSQFLRTIDRFQLLPQFLTSSVAVAILTSEVVVLTSLFKSQLLAFTLSAILLIIFTIVLASLLVRDIRISCNCFGDYQHPVTFLELVRNLGFLLFSCCGVWLSAESRSVEVFSSSDAGTVWLAAIAFTLIWMHIGEVYHAFQSNKSIS